MKIPRAPHRWKVTPKQAVAIQKLLASSVRQARPRGPIRFVTGVDSAFSADDEGREKCIAAAVVWDLEGHCTVEQRVVARDLSFPYVPGLLSFREAPAVIAALRRLRRRPDAILCDGHGLAHPRRFGIACHVGVITGVPTIGCAKSRLVGDHGQPDNERGGRAALVHRGQAVGTVLRTQDGVNPVFVSVGHKTDLRTAERIVLACATRYRLPEPTRLADRLVAAVKRGSET